MKQKPQFNDTCIPLEVQWYEYYGGQNTSLIAILIGFQKTID